VHSVAAVPSNTGAFLRASGGLGMLATGQVAWAGGPLTDVFILNYNTVTLQDVPVAIGGIHGKTIREPQSREIRVDRPSKAANCVELKSSEHEKCWMDGCGAFGIAPCPSGAGCCLVCMTVDAE
jgi:hypothetical protein